jgi:hypothetical protein
MHTSRLRFHFVRLSKICSRLSNSINREEEECFELLKLQNFRFYTKVAHTTPRIHRAPLLKPGEHRLLVGCLCFWGIHLLLLHAVPTHAPTKYKRGS